MAETWKDTPTPSVAPSFSGTPVSGPASEKLGETKPGSKRKHDTLEVEEPSETDEEECDEEDDFEDDAIENSGIDLGSVPGLDDTRAPRPKQGELHLSKAAINSRLRRLMKPNVHGTYKVSQEVIKDFNSTQGRKTIDQIFQMCGYDPDRVPKQLFWSQRLLFWCFFKVLVQFTFVFLLFVLDIHCLVKVCKPHATQVLISAHTFDQETFVQECEVLRSEMQEQEVKIEGEFASKQYMLDTMELSEKLGGSSSMYYL